MSSLSGIKKILDAYITANYSEVRTYTNYMLKRLMLSKKLNYINLKADTVINNAYLHVAGIDDHEADENKVKSYLLNTIKMQIWWPTSLSRKQDEVYSQEYIATDKPEDDEITDKLKHEEIINLRKACINTYLNELISPVEKRIADAYFTHKCQTSRAMADYFDIPRTSAYYMIKALKQRIKEIEYSYINGKD
jgi:hypothetical protein